MTAVYEDEHLAILSLRGKTGSCINVLIGVNGLQGTAFVDAGATSNHIGIVVPN